MGGGGGALDAGDVCEDALPLATCRLGAGGGGFGFLGAACCACCFWVGYSRTKFLMYSISRAITSLGTLPSKSPIKAAQDGSTPFEVNPDSAS